MTFRQPRNPSRCEILELTLVVIDETQDSIFKIGFTKILLERDELMNVYEVPFLDDEGEIRAKLNLRLAFKKSNSNSIKSSSVTRLFNKSRKSMKLKN